MSLTGLAGNGGASAPTGAAGGDLSSASNYPFPLLDLTKAHTWTGTQTAPLSDHGGQVFNVMAYGGVGDGVTIADGAMTAPSAILTSATAGFTAADIGKSIVVVGAGAAGVPLFTTILSYQSATQVTLNAAAATTVTTAGATYGTDDTAAVNAALVAAAVNGGTVACPRVHICLGKIVIPTFTLSILRERSIRITGGGPSSTFGTRWLGSSALILRDNADGTAKIEGLGVGYLEIDHISLIDDSGGNLPFILVTNPVTHIHHVTFRGSKTGTACDQDAIILGGTTTTNDGTANSPFGGYGSVVRECEFQGIRRAAYLRRFCNGVVIESNAIAGNCGTGLASGAAIEIDGQATGNDAHANVISNNTIELTNYIYGVRIANGHGNAVLANGFYDPGGSTLAYVRQESTAFDTIVLGLLLAEATIPTISDASGGKYHVLSPTGPRVRYDTVANRPSAASIGDRTLYVATDLNGGNLQQAQGGAWTSIAPALHAATHIPGGTDEVYTMLGIMPSTRVETIARTLVPGITAALTVGTGWLTYFVPQFTKTVTTLYLATGGTAPGTGATNVYIALYTANAAGQLLTTLLAQTDVLANAIMSPNNDFSTGSALYTVTIPSTVLTFGQRTCFALLQVGGTAPRLVGIAGNGSIIGNPALPPVGCTATAASQSALPSSLPYTPAASGSQMIWAGFS